MSSTFSDHESVSADQLEVAINELREQQNLRFPRSSYWREFCLFTDAIDSLSEEDPSGLGGFILAPASLVDSLPSVTLPETDVQALRKDWVAIGNDLRIAMLQHRLKNTSRMAEENR